MRAGSRGKNPISAPRVKKQDEDADYERDKVRAAHSDAVVRRDLAREHGARPEILYYLANDRAATVRREIAANPQTPFQADLLLLKDPDADVRGDLALKLARFFCRTAQLTHARDHLEQALELRPGWPEAKQLLTTVGRSMEVQ